MEALPASYGATAVASVQTFKPHVTTGYVLCCLCGTSIQSNPSNMCVNCIRSQVDITEGIQKQVRGRGGWGGGRGGQAGAATSPHAGGCWGGGRDCRQERTHAHEVLQGGWEGWGAGATATACGRLAIRSVRP